MGKGKEPGLYESLDRPWDGFIERHGHNPKRFETSLTPRYVMVKIIGEKGHESKTGYHPSEFGYKSLNGLRQAIKRHYTGKVVEVKLEPVRKFFDSVIPDFPPGD